MARAVDEWVGKGDDEAPPPRVKLRLFESCGGRCQSCGIEFRGKTRPEYDHAVAIINGGENRESNIQVLCQWCHKEKTGSDVREKSIIAKKRKSAIGIKKKRSITSWRLFNGTIKKVSKER